MKGIRNVALVSHGGAGKTTLVEAILFNAGVTSRMGSVDEGNTVSDYTDEEKERGFSIQCAIAPLIWKDVKINLLDTPGYLDFVGEVVAALRVVESALILVDAVSGVEVGTESVWEKATSQGLARMFFISRLDKENASFARTMEAMKTTFQAPLAPLQLPIGEAQNFKGFVDLVEMKAFVDGKEGEIPSELMDQVNALREDLVEAAAEVNEEILERFVSDEEIPPDMLRAAIKEGVKQGSIIPVLCGSAVKGIGIKELLDAIVEYLPAPDEAGEVVGSRPGDGEQVTRKPDPSEPLAALVFKTISDPYVGRISLFRVYSGTMRPDSVVLNANKGVEEKIGQPLQMRGKQQEPVGEIMAGDIGAVTKLSATLTGDTLCDPSDPIVLPGIEFPEPAASLAVEPKSREDEERIMGALQRISEEDQTFKAWRDNEVRQLIIAGMGDLHLDVVISRLKKQFGAEVKTSLPKVPYKETITTTSTAEGKYVKQTGGRGQYGWVWIRMEPLERGAGWEFKSEIKGGAIPSQFIPAVEKGIANARNSGILAGYPVVDFRVVLYDGKYHEVDSSDIAFQIAASKAFKEAMRQAKPVLLEPIYEVEIVVPERYVGDVIGDLNSKRGRVLEMVPKGKNQVIRALVPLAEMRRYAADLRSITGGRGFYSMKFSHYEEVPPQIAQSIIEEAQRERKEEEEE